jgi:hypothetical protein
VNHGFQLVHIGQGFDRDIETYQAKPNLLHLRVSPWREASGLDHASPSDQLPFGEEEMETARRTFEQIIRLFERSERQSRDHKRHAAESDFSARMKQICGKMRGLSVSRMNIPVKASWLTKTKWALIGCE